MKVIKENYENFPDELTNIATSVEGQALEDTEVFDKRKEETEKEIEKNIKLPLDGAPKAEKPEAAKVPEKLGEAYDPEIRHYSNMLLDMVADNELDPKWVVMALVKWCSEDDIAEFMKKNELLASEADESFISGPQETSDKSLTENINEEDAARIVQEVLKNSFNIDVDVESYNDDQSKATIIQFILSKEDNNKVVYDEFKEKLYKRFNHNVNISCKTFSSPNLEEHRVEYKIKVLVIKEKKNKYGATKSMQKTSQNQRESLIIDEAKEQEPVELFEIVWNDLSADNDHDYRRIPAINADLKCPYKMAPIYPNSVRYQGVDSDSPFSNVGSDAELGITDDGNIKITPKGNVHGKKNLKDFSFAEHVADVYKDYGVRFHINETPDKHGNTFGIMEIPAEFEGVDITEQEKAWQKEMKAKKKAEIAQADTEAVAAEEQTI